MNQPSMIPWKLYTVTILETWIAFCIATFSMGVYFSHLDSTIGTMLVGALLSALYLFVIIVCIKRLIERLPIAALMLLVPIAPLAVLLLIVSLLPILQKLR